LIIELLVGDFECVIVVVCCGLDVDFDGSFLFLGMFILVEYWWVVVLFVVCEGVLDVVDEVVYVCAELE